jgi:hypothetical protein
MYLKSTNICVDLVFHFIGTCFMVSEMEVSETLYVRFESYFLFQINLLFESPLVVAFFVQRQDTITPNAILKDCIHLTNSEGSTLVIGMASLPFSLETTCLLMTLLSRPLTHSLFSSAQPR